MSTWKSIGKKIVEKYSWWLEADDCAAAIDAAIAEREQKLRKEILDVALRTRNAHCEAEQMQCRCPSCRHAESFAVEISNIYCDIDRSRSEAKP